jgi:hypothetical protein
LRALEARARRSGRPCGLSTRTEALADFTRALATAYPHVDTSIGTTRHFRARLRSALDAKPGLLLLDHLHGTGTAFKGALKSIRGMGAGVLLAADVDHPRDFDHARSLRLTHVEIPLPRLHGQSMRVLLRSLLDARTLPHPVSEEDFSALVSAAEGLPGRAVGFADALRKSSAWGGNRPRCEWLRSEAFIASAERYRTAG